MTLITLKEGLIEHNQLESLPRLAYLAFLETNLGKRIFCTVENLDDLYTGMVSGVLGNLGRGKTPEIIDELSTVAENDRHTPDSYNKLYMSLVVDLGIPAFPFEPSYPRPQHLSDRLSVFS
jgi:hypothetical protein